MGLVLGPHAHTNRPRETRVGGTPAARPKGPAAGGGTAPNSRRPSERWNDSPPRTALHHSRGTQPPTGHASQRDSAGPRPHTVAHSTWVADLDSPP